MPDETTSNPAPVDTTIPQTPENPISAPAEAVTAPAPEEAPVAPSPAPGKRYLTPFIAVNPVGFGLNFVTIHHADEVRIVKARLACKSLRDRSIRIIYAHHRDSLTFMYIEMYFKGEKENEERTRIAGYLKSLK